MGNRAVVTSGRSDKLTHFAISCPILSYCPEQRSINTNRSGRSTQLPLCGSKSGLSVIRYAAFNSQGIRIKFNDAPAEAPLSPGIEPNTF